MTKVLRMFGMLSLALMLSGCINYEVLETRIEVGGQDRASTIVLEYQNLSSDGKNPAEVDNDFKELINAWKGEKVLVNMAKGGIYAKSREVLIQDGKIVARVTGLTEPGTYEDLADVNGNWDCWLGKDAVVLETNGTAYQEKEGDRQGWHISWPKTSTGLYWRYGSSVKSEANQKVFLEKLQNYLKETSQETKRP